MRDVYPRGITTGWAQYAKKHILIHRFAVSKTNVRHCDCLQIQSTIVDLAAFGWSKGIGLEHHVHDVNIVGTLDWWKKEGVKFQRAINMLKKRV
jgi:hypothetical protein